MIIRIGLAQTFHPEDGNVVDLVDVVADHAKKAKVDILVFPESLMMRYESEKQAFLEAAQAIDGAFSTAIDRIAAHYGIWIVYTINELNDSGGKPFNTCIITDDHGVKQGVYRKVHLFKSDKIYESDRMAAGDEIFTPIATPFGRIGLGICYDLRFPEYARKQALAGCDIMLYPAAWVDGKLKATHWKTLLRARAIENQCFVAGVCRPDKGCVGESFMFAPDGALRAESPKQHECLEIAEIDLDEIAAFKAQIPALDNRRPELYI